jgi:hypothetical protein
VLGPAFCHVFAGAPVELGSSRFWAPDFTSRSIRNRITALKGPITVTSPWSADLAVGDLAPGPLLEEAEPSAGDIVEGQSTLPFVGVVVHLEGT